MDHGCCSTTYRFVHEDAYTQCAVEVVFSLSS
uniref:Uncharacterized protein n=1 Tax=Arundo donax TaxID=35708 RepID=A0A0A9G348_ARUDO